MNLRSDFFPFLLVPHVLPVWLSFVLLVMKETLLKSPVSFPSFHYLQLKTTKFSFPCIRIFLTHLSKNYFGRTSVLGVSLVCPLERAVCGMRRKLTSHLWPTVQSSVWSPNKGSEGVPNNDRTFWRTGRNSSRLFYTIYFYKWVS